MFANKIEFLFVEFDWLGGDGELFFYNAGVVLEWFLSIHFDSLGSCIPLRWVMSHVRNKSLNCTESGQQEQILMEI